MLGGATRNRSREIVDALTSCGLHALIDLPQIAVMGDTSAGKSSVLSAVAQIEFPSAADLCTVCPIQVHMKNSEQEAYKVEIMWSQLSAPAFRKTCSTAAEVPVLIAEAQQAMRDALKGSGRGVSSDIIEAKLQGPTYVDLTLIDLPGIVRVTGKNESATMVEDINALMKRYLENKRCIIIPIVAANNDFHNTEILQKARIHDPKTERSLPVITKPDLVDRGGEKGVLKLLKGESISDFALGFHMVRNRGQHDIDNNVSLQDAVHKERAYFEGHEVWGPEKRHNPTSFGVDQLREKLSDKYLDLVNETLPEMLQEIQKCSERTDAELRRVGKELLTEGDRRSFFASLLESLTQLLDERISPLMDEEGRSYWAQLEAVKERFAVDFSSSEKAKDDDEDEEDEDQQRTGCPPSARKPTHQWTRRE